jgi:hypothetical protein
MDTLAPVYTNSRTVTVRFFVVGSPEPDLAAIMEALAKR